MRILLTTDTVGGVWTFGRELTAGLLERGHAVALVSFGRALSAEQSRWITQMSAHWDREHFLFEASEAPLEWMEANDRAFAEGAEVLRRIVAEFRPEVMHTSQFCWGALPLGLPIVITAHSDVLSWAAACRPEGLEDSDWLRTYVRLVTAGLAGADAVVAPTEWMGCALAKHFPVPDGFSVVANGRSAPNCRDGRSSPREARAISVGRIWDEAKGMRLLAEGRWTMPVVIAGENRFGEDAEVRIAGVTALGVLGEEELQAELHASAVYLCLSIYEPFGLAAVEAGLCGCAVVCRDLASLREIWGEDATYFSDGDDLRSILHGFAVGEGRLGDMQDRARRRATRYSQQRMTEGYVRMYEGLVGPTHRGQAAVNGTRTGVGV